MDKKTILDWKLLVQKIINNLPKIEIKNKDGKYPIVFIHGFNSSFEVHQEFYNRYKGADYYSISLPGNNLLPAEKEQLNVSYYAKLVAAYIKLKKLKNVILMGHSMGGGIISLVAQKIPELIYKMVYVAPMNKTSLVLKKLFLNVYFPKNLLQLNDFIKNLYYQPDFLNDEEYQKQLASEFDYNLYNNENILILGNSLPKMSLMNKLEKALNNLTVPVLLILGEDDGIILKDKCIAYFEEHVKNLKFAVIPKTGHMIFKENPEAYIDIIDKFINEN